MQIAEFEQLFENVKLTRDMRTRLSKICGRPEGEVEVRWIHKLITHYSYASEQIALQVPAGAGRNAAKSVVYADIVVYRDKHKREPFVVIETKKPGSSDYQGVKQAESYARNLGTEYHVWSDWNRSLFFKTARFIDQSTPVGNIPTWVEGKVLLHTYRRSTSCRRSVMKSIFARL